MHDYMPTYQLRSMHPGRHPSVTYPDSSFTWFLSIYIPDVLGVVVEAKRKPPIAPLRKCNPKYMGDYLET